jgi:ATP-dependent Clp protease ATP-binding subunit ClpA
MSNNSTQLDLTLRSVESQEFENRLRSNVVGRGGAVRALVGLFQVYGAEMRAVGRPVGTYLFLGPAGSGKTRIVEAAAEILFGDPRAVKRLSKSSPRSMALRALIRSPRVNWLATASLRPALRLPGGFDRCS